MGQVVPRMPSLGGDPGPAERRVGPRRASSQPLPSKYGNGLISLDGPPSGSTDVTPWLQASGASAGGLGSGWLSDAARNSRAADASSAVGSRAARGAEQRVGDVLVVARRQLRDQRAGPWRRGTGGSSRRALLWNGRLAPSRNVQVGLAKSNVR